MTENQYTQITELVADADLVEKLQADKADEIPAERRERADEIAAHLHQAENINKVWHGRIDEIPEAERKLAVEQAEATRALAKRILGSF